MPYPRRIRVPQTFLPCREIKRDLTPAEFLDYYYGLCHVINTAQTDIQTIMHFRGWCAYGASSGPKCVMRKTFPTGRTVATNENIAPEIEAMICSTLEAKAAVASAPQPALAASTPPAPARRRRRHRS